MKRTHFHRIVPMAAATLLLMGCMAETDDKQALAEGNVPFGLTASVTGMNGGLSPITTRRATRAVADIQSTQFEAGETFYAYFPSGASIGSTTFELSQAEGEATGISDGKTTPATQPYFATGVSNVRVHAYYPQTVTNTTTSFSVQLDQTGEGGYKNSDLMYATTEVAIDRSAATSATGNLTFTHKMTKIIVNATAGAGINTIRKVCIIGGAKTISIAAPVTTDESTTAYLGTTVSDRLSAADDGCVRLYDNATGVATVNCAALIPPQRIPAEGSTETPFLQVTTDQGTATYCLSGKAFDSGSSTIYHITVTLADLGLTTDITDWDASAPIELANNGQAELLELEAVPNIGDYYYNDGTWSTVRDDSKTVIGLVFCTTPTADDQARGYKHGYVIALKDYVDATATKWADATADVNGIMSDYSITQADQFGGKAVNTTLTEPASIDLNGLTNTLKIAAKAAGKTYGSDATLKLSDITDAKYHAAYKAVNYTEGQPTLTAPAKSSGWYLPSIGQQYLWLWHFGNVRTVPPTFRPEFADCWWNNPAASNAATAMDTYFTEKVGAGNYTAWSTSKYYWSSTVRSSASGYPFYLGFGYDGVLFLYGNGNATSSCRVRPVLAF